MKNTLLLLSFALMSIFAFGQTPQAFKYQAVARDLNGNPVNNQEISVKISILAGSPEGTVVYSELHQTITNSLGLFGLEIGNPTQVLSGNFAAIDWGGSSHFLETAVDLSGGGQFQILGVTQFLSVPYSKYADFATIANGIQTMTEQERNALENPPVGMQIFNTTTNCLNYFNGTGWYETCGTCIPMPSQAYAGEDQYFGDETTSTNLGAYYPESGIGTWSIMGGNGGFFEDVSNPNTLFTGLPCETYYLLWTVSTQCGSSYDDVFIFFNGTTAANAGPDEIVNIATTTTLQGNTPLIGNGQWSIISGNDGFVTEPSNPTSTFTGQSGETYVLQWTISLPCSSSSDEVTIQFINLPCGMTITDSRDGQVYPTVLIGTQCWMQKNLNVGTLIGSFTGQSNNGTIEKYCADNLESNCDIYGGLYYWNEMMEYSTNPVTQGICPVGWHLPSNEEWVTLISFLGGRDYAGGKMKEAGTIHWNSPNTGATNSSGFTALPGRKKFALGDFYSPGMDGFFWTTNSQQAYHLLYFRQWIWEDGGSVNDGMSVRCLKGFVPQITVLPVIKEVTCDAGSTTFEITSNIPWAITEEVDWLSVSPMNGNSDATATISYDENQTYEPREAQITITGEGGTPVINFTLTQTKPCSQPFTDSRDEQVYSVVQIGTQCWMAQNLNVGTIITGDPSDNGIIEKYCYANDETNCDVYGGLYKWNELMGYSTTPGIQGICPTGWHVPTDTEFTALTTYVSSQPEYLCDGNSTYIAKALADTSYWATSPNTCAVGNNAVTNNATGFSGLPGGWRYYDGNNSGSKTTSAYWYSSSRKTTNFPWYWRCQVNIGTFDQGYMYDASSARSLRCLRD